MTPSCSWCHLRPQSQLCPLWHNEWINSFIVSFMNELIHSFHWHVQNVTIPCRFFFHSSLLRTFSCHPSPPTTFPSSLTSSCHLYLGLLCPCTHITLPTQYTWDLVPPSNPNPPPPYTRRMPKYSCLQVLLSIYQPEDGHKSRNM